MKCQHKIALGTGAGGNIGRKFLVSNDGDLNTGHDCIVDGGRVSGPQSQKVNEE